MFLHNVGVPELRAKELCAYYQGALPTGKNVQVNCTKPLFGQYVTVLLPTQKSGDVEGAPLSLCEVEVRGRQAAGK